MLSPFLNDKAGARTGAETRSESVLCIHACMQWGDKVTTFIPSHHLFGLWAAHRRDREMTAET